MVGVFRVGKLLLIHVVRVSCVRVMLMIMMCILVIMCAAPPIIVGSNTAIDHTPTIKYNIHTMIVILRCDDIIMIIIIMP